MSLPVVAALTRSAGGKKLPHLRAFAKRIEALPAYQRAVKIGGPVVMG